MPKESTRSAATQDRLAQTDVQTLSDLISSQAVDLINANADGITQEILTAEDAKLSLSIGFKLSVVNHRLYCNGTVAYSRKFKDEIEGSAELVDPEQTKLPLESSGVTVTTGDGEEVFSGTTEEFSRAVKRAARK